MKNFRTKTILTSGVIAVFIVLFTSVMLFSFATGIDGRTLKTTTVGCSCHNSTSTPSVIVFISGPDTVIAGQTATYTVEISESTKNGAGLDVSTRYGSLGVLDPNTHLSNGEINQSTNFTMTNHAVIIQFSYTAPLSPVTDTIWATGLATNSNGQSNGDIWNWANSKRVNVRSPLGISPNGNNVPSKFSLGQNYPNPFNPSTNIEFGISKRSFVSLTVYNSAGQQTDRLVNEELEAGSYKVNFNAAAKSSGIYFYEIRTSDFTETKKMILIK